MRTGQFRISFDPAQRKIPQKHDTALPVPRTSYAIWHFLEKMPRQIRKFAPRRTVRSNPPQKSTSPEYDEHA